MPAKNIDMLVVLLETLDEIESLLHENCMKNIGHNDSWKKFINQMLEKIGLHITSSKRFSEWQQYYSHDPQGLISSLQTLKELIAAPNQLESVYSLLDDDKSRETFIWFIKYRIAYVCLSNRATAVYSPPVDFLLWEKCLADIETSKLKLDVCKIGPYFIRCTDPSALLGSWSEEVYRLKGICEPEKGDWIIDGGAFQGDTTLWFSNLVGPEGKVFAFEPFGENYDILVENVKKNNIENVIPIPKALYNKSCAFSMMGDGQGAMLVEGNSNVNVIETISIDEYTQSQNCSQVNFIKMDIEGAEAPALEGAVKTIKRYLPKLAISVYHKGTDIVAIPKLIKNIEPNYKLYLRHRSNSWVDTVLYAVIH